MFVYSKMQINFQSETVLLSLLFIILPNIFFWLVGWYLNLSRPLINLDYILPIALFILPFRLSKIIGFIAFLLAFLFDITLFAMQLFPFMDLAAIRYLAPFLSNAPARYLVLVGIVLLYWVLMPIFIIKISHKVSLKWTYLWLILLGLVYSPLKEYTYKEAPVERFSRGNYFLIKSQYQLYSEHYNSDFISQMRAIPKLSALDNKQKFASFYLNKKPYSNKILFIIAESWGVARQKEVQQFMLQKIYEQQENFEFINDGSFDASGSTVQAELRELCQLQVMNGYALSKTPNEKFSSCLGNIFKDKGYQTVAMHGASSQLYDRFSWYQKAGFQKILFAESMPANMKRCYAFNGVCDSEIRKLVANEFQLVKNQKIFLYWLTLTSHAPYEPDDLINSRLDCNRYELSKGDICNNMRLETQFFDDLAELIQQPEMKGVEVVVVGDHMPPIMGDVPLYKNLRWQEVSWLHFKVK